MGLIIVTNPELGWDCVVAVYNDTEISKKELENLYDTNIYVLTSISLTSLSKNINIEKNDEIIEEIITSNIDFINIELIIDNLKIVSDSDSLLHSNEGMMLNKKDFHILGNIFNKLVIDKNIDLNGGHFCIVTVPAGRYTTYEFSYLGFTGFSSKDIFLEKLLYEIDEHLNLLNIKLH